MRSKIWTRIPIVWFCEVCLKAHLKETNGEYIQLYKSCKTIKSSDDGKIEIGIG
jgi:hypothetical protein